MARIFSQLTFWILMTVIIVASAVVVVAFYLPFVAAKAAYLTLAGKARLRTDPENGV